MTDEQLGELCLQYLVDNRRMLLGGLESEFSESPSSHSEAAGKNLTPLQELYRQIDEHQNQISSYECVDTKCPQCKSASLRIGYSRARTFLVVDCTCCEWEAK